MNYILDSNVFIQAKKHYYRFIFCPAFWDFLEIQNQHNKIISIDKVHDELLEGNDVLSIWSNFKGRDFFVDSNSPEINYNIDIIYEGLNEDDYYPSQINEFYNCADIWLIACAITWNRTIVTLENIRKKKGKIKIPEICKKHGVRCISTFDMLQECETKFILESNIVF